MTHDSGRAYRRARRLLLVYPPAWRDRFGEEFVELLVADIDDRPRSWRRAADVVANGGLARLTSAGLAGHLPDATERARTSLASMCAAGAIFFLFGTAMLSQIVVGWRWEPPNENAVAIAMVLMSSMVIVGVALAALAVPPLLWAGARAVRNGHARPLLAPAALIVAGAAMLVLGSSHFAPGWPGTGGHDWAYHDLAHPGAGALGWAATRGVTSYWAHPSALASFPLAEVAWMALSPVAVVYIILGAVKAIRRLDLSPRAWLYEACLARAGAAVMSVFLVGAACWVLADGAPGPTGIYQVGMIDVVALVIMGVAWVAAFQAARRTGPLTLSAR